MCTTLLKAALGPDKVIAIHVDNGLMRKDESRNVVASLRALGVNLHGEEGISMAGVVWGLHTLGGAMHSTIFST